MLLQSNVVALSKHKTHIYLFVFSPIQMTNGNNSTRSTAIVRFVCFNGVYCLSRSSNGRLNAIFVPTCMVAIQTRQMCFMNTKHEMWPLPLKRWKLFAAHSGVSATWLKPKEKDGTSTLEWTRDRVDGNLSAIVLKVELFKALCCHDHTRLALHLRLTTTLKNHFMKFSHCGPLLERQSLSSSALCH